ncbi:protein phosphatase 1 regulatory subunit 14C isoform X4 [Hippopotamus amphibius kiboko]|uniref:protein phosphatase 1 regulatory subunit 14C isoform X4 n=1 Tax=Hippopotamus amphibius kiboko TaxID=575201 RepID=UPI0025930D5A|nr:protein phosphatase 1 regulatory subunit 14C isoform X4 [Hippopotamus amphibius kiboko]
MSVATGSSEAAGGAGGGGARVFFQSPRGGAGGSPGSSSGSGSSREDSAPVATASAAGHVQQQQQQQQRRHQQGKVTVKYDRKELRKRLVLEEWIVEQLGQLYGCENLVPAQRPHSEEQKRAFSGGWHCEPRRRVGVTADCTARQTQQSFRRRSDPSVPFQE